MIKNIAKFVYKFRFGLLVAGLAPMLTGCELLLKLLGLGLVNTGGGELPYRAVTTTVAVSEQAESELLYGAFIPKDEQ